MRKNLTITLDRERELRLDLNAMAEFEELTGRSLFLLNEKLAEARNMRAVLYCALKSAGEEISQDEIGKLITFGNFKYVTEVIQKLMTDSFGEPSESAETGEKGK